MPQPNSRSENVNFTFVADIVIIKILYLHFMLFHANNLSLRRICELKLKVSHTFFCMEPQDRNGIYIVCQLYYFDEGKIKQGRDKLKKLANACK